jgi:glyoxylase-like metal-dependent hydrolase (beta-lactamase superfamily II)
MVDEVMDRLYRIEVPLPNSPLKELNSYVFKGDGRNLIIDTGFNRTVCYEAMREGLRALDIDPAKTDFMITHMHSDHAGLVARLASGTSTVYFSRIDSQVFDKDRSWQPMVDYAQMNGFPADELMKALQNHPGFKYKPETVPELTLIGEADVIEIGAYRLRALGTPGHTQGHICLYDEDRRVLISGDHILYDITPHIESWAYQVNSLKDYLASLEKVYDLPVAIVLPGHRRFFTDLKGRIDALREHHRHRADEVLAVLGTESRTAYEVAARMTWDIDCESWELFPVAQKWFATGEALAHLRYLEGEGRIKRNSDRKIFTFAATGN